MIPTRYARAAEDSYVAYQVVGDGPISRGEHELKGVPGRFQLFAVRT